MMQNINGEDVSSNKQKQDDFIISSHKLNQSFDNEFWEIDSPDKVSLEDSSSGRLSAFYLSTLKQHLNFTEQNNGSDELPKSPQSTGQTGVMEAADRAVQRVADARDEVQKKTFTKWVNKYLAKVNRNIKNLYEDLRDGHNLIALLETLSQTTLPREKGQMRFHRLQNVQIALDFLRQRKLRFVNIRNDDITDGNPKLTLGLIWTIILHFQIEEISLEGSDDISAKQALLIWAQRNMDGYDGIEVRNFSSSWQNGKAFNAILHRNGCDLIDMDKVMAGDNTENLDQAFSLAEKEFGVTRLLDSEDVNVNHPDERSIITYISLLYDMFPQIPPLPVRITAEEWSIIWEEYILLKVEIIKWIEERIVIMRRGKDIDLAGSLKDVEVLQQDLEDFKAKDLKQKEADIQTLTSKYRNIEEISLESRGKYQPISGNEPLEVTNKWILLLEAIEVRTEELRIKLERIKYLDDFIGKLKDAILKCQEKLNRAESGIKQIENGDQDKSLPDDVSKLLECCQSQIPIIVDDVKKLEEEKCEQAEPLNQSVSALVDKLAQLQSQFQLALLKSEEMRIEAEKKNAKVSDTKEYEFLQRCIRLADKYQIAIENLPWGNDAAEVKSSIQQLDAIEENIDQLTKDLATCRLDQKTLEGFNDSSTYDKLLAIFESKMATLENDSKVKKTQFDDLLAFMSESAQHLKWMKEKEEQLLSKDVCSSELSTMESIFTSLTRDCEARKPHIDAILESGAELQSHPASTIVSAYVASISEKWKLLSSLLQCLEQHVKDLAKQKSFDELWSKCQENISACAKKLSAIQEEIPGKDDLASVTEQLKNVENQIATLQATVDEVAVSSSQLPCVKERYVDVCDGDKMSLAALCDYVNENVSVTKNEECTLIDNTSRNVWKIDTSRSDVTFAPSLIFRMLPSSKRNKEKAQGLALTLDGLKECCEKSKTQCQFNAVLKGFKTRCNEMMSLELADLKNTPPSEREDMLIQASNDLVCLCHLDEDLGSDEASKQLQECTDLLEQCSAHVGEMLAFLNKANEHEEKCQTCLSELHIFMKRVIGIRTHVITRILAAQPMDEEEVERIADDHKKSVEELEGCEDEFHQVCAKTRRVIQEDPTSTSSETISSHLDIAVRQWKSTWVITHTYHEKLMAISVILSQMNGLDSAISDIEVQLSRDADNCKDDDDVKKVLLRKSFLEELQVAISSQADLAQHLKTSNEELQEISTQVIYPIHINALNQTTDCDATLDDDVKHTLNRLDAAYLEKMNKLLERLRMCELAVTERLAALLKILPEVERVASEENTCQVFVKKLGDMRKKIEEMIAQQVKVLSNPLPDDITTVEQYFHDQQNTVHEVEEMRSEYDSLQSEVINFINSEATGKAESSGKLRDELHLLQSSWNKLWEIGHILLEKIKGLLHLAKGLEEVGAMVDKVEDVVLKFDKDCTNLEDLNSLNMQIENVITLCPTIDDNMTVLSTNLSSVQSVVARLPDDIDASDDIDQYRDRVTNLEGRWKELKEKLQKLSIDIDAVISNLEKAEELNSQISDALEKVRKFNKALGTILESQKAEAATLHPLDVPSLQEGITQQNNIADDLRLLSGQYYDICADCSDKANVTQVDSSAAENCLIEQLIDEHQKMVGNWENANQLADLAAAKMKGLREAVEKLNALEEIVTHNESILSRYPSADALDFLQKHQEDVSKLANEIPVGDQVAADAKKEVEDLMEVGEKIRMLESLDKESKKSVEISLCKERLDSLEESWKKAKEEIARQLESLQNSIDQAKAEAQCKDAVATLLADIGKFRANMRKLASEQKKRADATDLTDEAAISEAIEQQQDTMDHLGRAMKEEYDDLQCRCETLLKSEDILSSLLPTLDSDTVELSEEWKELNSCAATYMAKLLSAQKFIKCYNVAEAKLKLYQAEIQKLNAVAASLADCSPAEINQAEDALQSLKDQIDEDEVKIIDVEEALEECRCLPDAASDKDIPFFVEKSKNLKDDWEKMKNAIHQMQHALADELELSEKRDLMNQKCEDFLTELKSLLKNLVESKEIIQTGLYAPLPLDVESIEAALEQEEEMGEKLATLRTDGEGLQAKSETLTEIESPNAKQLKDKFDEFFDVWSVAHQLHEDYLKRMKGLREAVEKLNALEEIVTHNESILSRYPSADALDFLQKHQEDVSKLAKEIPIGDQVAADAKKEVEDLMEVGDKIRMLESLDEESKKSVEISLCKEILDSLEESWKKAKEEIARQLESLQISIDQAKAEAQCKDAVATLLADIGKFRAKMRKLASELEERADATDLTDEAAISEAIEQQQDTMDHLGRAMKEEYDDLQCRCETLLKSEDILSSLLPTLDSDIVELSEEWKELNSCAATYMAKLLSAQKFIKCYNVAEAKLKLYQAEIQKLNAVAASLADCSPAEINQAKDALQSLKDQIDEDEVKITDVEEALEECRCLPDAASDKDIPFFVEKSKNLKDDWEKMKNAIHQMQHALADELELSEKRDLMNQKCEDCLTELKSLLKNLVESKEIIQTGLYAPLSLDVESIEAALEQEEEMGEKLATLRTDGEGLQAKSETLTEIESPNAKQLKDKFDEFFDVWSVAHQLHEDYLKRMKGLREAVENLNALEEIVTHNESILSRYPSADALDFLQKHQEDVSKLAKEIPIGDQVAADAKKEVEDLMEVGDKIRMLESLDEESKKSVEISLCKERLDSLEESWKKAKEEIARQMESLQSSIDQAKAEAQCKDAVVTLLADIGKFRAKMRKLASELEERADATDLTDEAAISEAIEQQQDTMNHLGGAMKEEYDDLQCRCETLLKSEDVLPSLLPTLDSDIVELSEEWKELNSCAATYMAKLLSAQKFIKCYNVAEAKLKLYQAEIQKLNAVAASLADCSPAEINQAKDALQSLKDQIDEDEVMITDVEEALEECRCLPDAASDKDIPFFVKKSENLKDDWKKMKNAIHQMQHALADELELSEKRDLMNQKCEDFLTELEALLKDLVESKEIIQTGLCAPLPLDVESIEAALEQEEEMGERLATLRTDGEGLQAKSETLTEIESPNAKQLKDKFDEFFDVWSVAHQLHEDYLKRLNSASRAASAVRVADDVISSYARRLPVARSMPGDLKSLQDQRQKLQELADEAPSDDEKFASVTHDCQELQTIDDSLKEAYGEPDSNFTALADELNKQWNSVKDEINKRLSISCVGEEKLSQLEDAADQQHSTLRDAEEVINEQDMNDLSQRDASELQRLIDEAKELQQNLEANSSEVDQMRELVDEFDSLARDYDHLPRSCPHPLENSEETESPSDATGDNVDKRRKFLDAKVNDVTQHIGKVRDLIADKISQLEAALQAVAVEEDEIIPTTSQKRSLADIKFETYLKKHASAHALHEAGIVSDDMADKLQKGILHESDVEMELKTYLKGTEPISGIILTEAGNKKISINTAVKLGLIKSGTGLVLLEAQAGTGNMIDPITAEHMSVAEAVERGVIDSKYSDVLSRAERAVTGYDDPVTRNILSLYECMNKGFIVEGHGIRLLEAQIATGGLIDPRVFHRVPISVAYNRGLFDERINKILEDPSDDTKGFFDPNTEKNLTYLELVNKCREDEETKLLFLELATPGIDVDKLLNSKKQPILKKQRSHLDIRFSTAFHEDATLDDIYEAGLVTEEQVRDLEHGVITEADLYDQLKPYLFGGKEPVCGVLLQESGEILSIVEASKRRIIKRGTAIELLEAQAATGNIIDPKTTAKMSVADAFKKGLIDRVHKDTLERAERAVKGYRIPGTNQIISLFGAMKKGLVVQSRGIRLLEAQIATGGLIDPMAHHRVPISVAFKRGLFDEDLHKILEDPSDDTKGFFDPNTEENLSYLDLMHRCEVKAPSNFRFLVIKPKEKRSSRARSKNVLNAKTKTSANDENRVKFPTICDTTISLEDIVSIGILPESTATDLRNGQISKEIVEKSIRPQLFGAPPVGGVIVGTTGEQMSFLECAKREIITSEEAYVYLEAQACTGGIIHPKTGDRLRVLEAYMSNLVARHHITSLQQAENAVFGNPHSGSRVRMSLAELLQKDLLTSTQASRIIHAQLATGGVVDSKRCIRLSKGDPHLDAILGSKLDCDSTDRTDFIDPISRTTKSYDEIMKVCKQDSQNGRLFLPCSLEASSTNTVGAVNGTLKNRADIYFDSMLNRQASLVDLLDAGIVTEDTVVALEEGRLDKEEVAQSIKQYLIGEQPIAGVIIEETGQTCGILEGVRAGIIKRGTGLELLEAQMATGSLVEPTTGQRLGVKEALQRHLIDGAHVDALERALRAVDGYKNPVTRGVLSFYEAMSKGYVVESRGRRLLEAQIATGGLIDPSANHRVPLPVAYRRGIISEKMFATLVDPSEDAKSFFDPNTNEKLTYLELISRCQTDPSTGLVYLNLRQKKVKTSRHARKNGGSASKKTKRGTQRTRKVVIIDPKTGAELTIKQAYKKKLIDKASAARLLAQEGEWVDEDRLKPDQTSSLPSPKTDASNEDHRTDVNLNGNSTQKDTFGDHLQARLQEMLSGCCTPISGIVDVKKGDCVSIREAEKRRLIDRTSAQRLLEAQVATGGIINLSDKSSRRYSVDEALATGLIEQRIAQKLEIAERAFKGFYSEKSKELYSLGQAIKKCLCYEECGSRFLEYQCCTGGLINPHDGSRVSLEQALNDEWIDARTLARLKNYRRYSKAFVDLKTNLLITYPEALDKSIVDPIAGHRVLEALPKLDRNLKMASGATIQASSLYSSRASSLAGSPDSSLQNSRRGSIDDVLPVVKSPSRA